MQLSIYSDKLISQVQQDFNSAYPFLKLEFFRSGGKEEDRHRVSQAIHQHRTLGDSWKWKKSSGTLDVNDYMTVLELENAFMNEFGLSVQVFRKSGNIWLETTLTDNWTLKRQSDHGKEISTGSKMGRLSDRDDFDREQNND